jgi:hypothetical protein
MPEEANGLSQSNQPVRAFICYRREDGAWYAEWLYRTLRKPQFVDAAGKERHLELYYDVKAPGVADWKKLHFPTLQNSHAIILVCTPGVSKDLSRSNSPDWVYEELNWWCNHRKSAPIVVDATGDGGRWLPEIVTKKWPNLNRIPLSREMVDAASVAGSTAELEASIWDRIFATLRESEQQTVFEDLQRLRTLSKRLIWALVLSGALTVTAAVAVGFALRAQSAAEESTRQAEKQAAIATGQAWRLYLLTVSRSASTVAQSDLNANQIDTNTAELLALINRTLQNPSDTNSAIYAVKILQCIEPHKGTAMLQAFTLLFNAFGKTKDPDLQKNLARLRIVVEADQKGLKRPKSPDFDRCDWVRFAQK